MKVEKTEVSNPIPECWNPERNVLFPLCIGNGSEACKQCSLFKDFTDGYWGF
jgi:hypothetical protein